jgi:hypothetical protein
VGNICRALYVPRSVARSGPITLRYWTSPVCEQWAMSARLNTFNRLLTLSGTHACSQQFTVRPPTLFSFPTRCIC